MLNVHPDDILLFKEVVEAMQFVAKQYDLPLKNVIGFPMPSRGMVDRLGDCSNTGEIRLVLRCTENGQWCEHPLNPDTVWMCAAHELAHLRHMNHGLAFQDFCEELQFAMNNRKVDHKQKVIEKLVKLQASRQSEAEIGNTAAAEAFAGMINKMLIEYELSSSDIDYARATDHDPVIEMKVNLGFYHIELTKVRCAWQETLAQQIARAHLCKILVRPSSNDIYFVGTKSHATVAEYVYGTMVPAVAKMSKEAEIKYWKETGSGRGKNNKALGYRASWIDSFIHRMWERFEDARQEAFAEAAGHISSETGMVRLGGALKKVEQYIEDKFSHKKAASRIGKLDFRSRNHEAGREAGRAAADNITLGKRGINGGSVKGQLS